MLGPPARLIRRAARGPHRRRPCGPEENSPQAARMHFAEATDVSGSNGPIRLEGAHATVLLLGLILWRRRLAPPEVDRPGGPRSQASWD